MNNENLTEQETLFELQLLTLYNSGDIPHGCPISNCLHCRDCQLSMSCPLKAEDQLGHKYSLEHLKTMISLLRLQFNTTYKQ